ncbi:hypothetical protein QJQ45_015181 [Haematococcus lacustris]|nr:hypothetical protein QJQ45_015181 [Haematococcus lacustris]
MHCIAAQHEYEHKWSDAKPRGHVPPTSAISVIPISLTRPTSSQVVKRRINMQGGNAATAGLQATASQAPAQGLPVHRAFLDVAGIEVPPLGLGLAALGRPGYINLGHARDLSAGTDREAMRQQCWRVLDAAYAAGIRYFDAARSYGAAEDFLSSWLAARSLTPGSVLVGSKWGYTYTADWRVDTGGAPHEVKDHSLPRLLAQSGESGALLGPWLRLYQVHSATLDSGVLQSREVLAELERLKGEQGWKIGLSLSGAGQAATLHRALQLTTRSGDLLFDSVQATWNLREQSVGPALLEAAEAGLHVIVKEAMANGRLLSRQDPDAGSPLQLMAAKLDYPFSPDSQIRLQPRCPGPSCGHGPTVPAHGAVWCRDRGAHGFKRQGASCRSQPGLGRCRAADGADAPARREVLGGASRPSLELSASGSGQQEDEGQGEQEVIAERRQVVKAAFRGLVEAAKPDLSPEEVDAVVAQANQRMTMGSMQCCLAAVMSLTMLLQSFLGQPTPGFPAAGPAPCPPPPPDPACPPYSHPRLPTRHSPRSAAPPAQLPPPVQLDVEDPSLLPQIKAAMDLLTNASVQEHLMRGPHHSRIRLLPGEVAVFEQPSSAWPVAKLQELDQVHLQGDNKADGVVAGGFSKEAKKHFTQLVLGRLDYSQPDREHKWRLPPNSVLRQDGWREEVVWHRGLLGLPAEWEAGVESIGKGGAGWLPIENRVRYVLFLNRCLEAWQIAPHAQPHGNSRRRPPRDLQVVNGMKWVSRQHYHQERGVAVFLGAGNFSQGGWKAGAVREGFRRVVQQPSRPSADPRPDRLVIVDEFRTSRVSSSVHARQPCELHLPDDRPRPADWVPPAGQVNHRLLRPAWSVRHAKCVWGLKWCHEVPPNPPPPPPPPAPLAQDPPAPAQEPPPPPPPAQDQPPPGPVPPPQAPSWGRWLDRDTNPCLNFQRIGESMQRPLELCRWTDLEALPPVGKEYQQRYKLVNDQAQGQAEAAPGCRVPAGH